MTVLIVLPLDVQTTGFSGAYPEPAGQGNSLFVVLVVLQSLRCLFLGSLCQGISRWHFCTIQQPRPQMAWASVGLSSALLVADPLPPFRRQAVLCRPPQNVTAWVPFI